MKFENCMGNLPTSKWKTLKNVDDTDFCNNDAIKIGTLVRLPISTSIMLKQRGNCHKKVWEIVWCCNKRWEKRGR